MNALSCVFTPTPPARNFKLTYKSKEDTSFIIHRRQCNMGTPNLQLMNPTTTLQHALQCGAALIAVVL